MTTFINSLSADLRRWPRSGISPYLLFLHMQISPENMLYFPRKSGRQQDRSVLSIIGMEECPDCALLRLEDSHTSLWTVFFLSQMNAGDLDKDFCWDVILFSRYWFASGQRFLFFLLLHISYSLNICWLIKKKKPQTVSLTHSTHTLTHTTQIQVDLITTMNEISSPLCYCDHYVHV